MVTLIRTDTPIKGAIRRLATLVVVAHLACPALRAIPPERRRAEPVDYCRRALIAGTAALLGTGLIWTSFSSNPPQPIELKNHGFDGAGSGRTAEGREWEAVLDRGGFIEGRIPRTGKGFREVTLFSGTPSHRLLADLARAQLTKTHPKLSFGKGPGVAIPLDRLELHRERNGDLSLVFFSPLGELRSQSPIPREAFLDGTPIVVQLGPLTIDGESGTKSNVEAAIHLRFVAADSRFEVSETVVRIHVQVPALFIDATDEARLPALSLPLSPSN